MNRIPKFLVTLVGKLHQSVKLCHRHGGSVHPELCFLGEVAQQRGATFQKRFILHVRDNTHFRRLTHGTLSFNIEESYALNLVVKELHPVRMVLGKGEDIHDATANRELARLNDKIYAFKLVFKKGFVEEI